MVLIWFKISEKKYRKLSWLPLLFFVVTPLSIWCVSNNMLENTMMIFTSLAVLFILKSLDNKRWLYLLLAGFMLYLGFLTKGPVALFPISLPLWIFMINRDINLKRFIIDTLVLALAVLTPLLIIYLIEPESITSLWIYFNKQVIGSLKNVKSVDNRFYIVWNLITNLIPVGIIMLIIYLLTLKKKIEGQKSKWAFVFIALGLSGVVPIMISMKQSSFYMLASIPFFCIAFADIIGPRIYYFTRKINYTGKSYKRFIWISYVLLAGSIAITALQVNRVDRDVLMISDVKKIIDITDKKTIITIPPEMLSSYILHGYFFRYGMVSLDYAQKYDNRFLLVKKGYKGDLLIGYNKYPLDLELYNLYEKANNGLNLK
jgi:4-amino-4-deoxy-L-arabinose transferase-like glycosyltransferase